MLAACAAPSPRGDEATARRASDVRKERDLARECRIAEEQQQRPDPRCPARPPRASRNPNLPLELPVELPERLF